MPIITWYDDPGSLTTRAEKHLSSRTWWESMLSSSHHQEWSRLRESKQLHDPTRYLGSLESLHVRLVFLLNTYLRATQDYFKFIKIHIMVKTTIFQNSKIFKSFVSWSSSFISRKRNFDSVTSIPYIRINLSVTESHSKPFKIQPLS